METEGITLVMRSSWPAGSETMFDPARSAGYTLVFSRPEAQVYRVQTGHVPQDRPADQ